MLGCRILSKLVIFDLIAMMMDAACHNLILKIKCAQTVFCFGQKQTKNFKSSMTNHVAFVKEKSPVITLHICVLLEHFQNQTGTEILTVGYI